MLSICSLSVFTVHGKMSSYNSMSEERTRHWLDSIDDVESIVESSIIDSSDSESGEELALGTHRSFDQSTVVTSKLYPTNTVPLHLDIFISSEQIN